MESPARAGPSASAPATLCVRRLRSAPTDRRNSRSWPVPVGRTDQNVVAVGSAGVVAGTAAPASAPAPVDANSPLLDAMASCDCDGAPPTRFHPPGRSWLPRRRMRVARLALMLICISRGPKDSPPADASPSEGGVWPSGRGVMLGPPRPVSLPPPRNPRPLSAAASPPSALVSPRVRPPLSSSLPPCGTESRVAVCRADHASLRAPPCAVGPDVDRWLMPTVESVPRVLALSESIARGPLVLLRRERCSAAIDRGCASGSLWLSEQRDMDAVKSPWRSLAHRSARPRADPVPCCEPRSAGSDIRVACALPPSCVVGTRGAAVPLPEAALLRDPVRLDRARDDDDVPSRCLRFCMSMAWLRLRVVHVVASFSTTCLGIISYRRLSFCSFS